MFFTPAKITTNSRRKNTHKSFHLHSIMFPLSWGLTVLLCLPKMGSISIRSLWKDHLQFHHNPLAKVLHIYIWPLINNGWDFNSIDTQNWVLRTQLLGTAWSWWAREGPGGLAAHTEEAGPLLESAQREARNTWQNAGKHACKMHPSFHTEWLRLYQSYLQMQLLS